MIQKCLGIQNSNSDGLGFHNFWYFSEFFWTVNYQFHKFTVIESLLTSNRNHNCYLKNRVSSNWRFLHTPKFFFASHTFSCEILVASGLRSILWKVISRFTRAWVRKVLKFPTSFNSFQLEWHRCICLTFRTEPWF